MAQPRRRIRVGIVGLGLMGRELASNTARWCHLLDLDFEPEITAICDVNPALFDWFDRNFDTIQVRSTDYRDLLNSDAVEAIYCAVPHNLHAQFYMDIIRAGKHLLGEKPFGIDLNANEQILAAAREHPEVVVACSSEFPFFPAAQRIIRAIQEGRFGQIIEVWSGFFHSSDLDPDKKINWKRMIDINGEGGCMNDLGLHVMHIPLRVGWQVQDVRAMLSNIVTTRPNAQGERVPCQTWDNATLACTASDGAQTFPMYLQMYRIAPGETNSWTLRVVGTEYSAEFSTKYPKTLRTMVYTPGREQAWQSLDMGYETAYPAITGGIFEFGFTDSLLQMWAAFHDEVMHGRDGMRQPFYCATPEETHRHHHIIHAALESDRRQAVVPVPQAETGA